MRHQIKKMLKGIGGGFIASVFISYLIVGVGSGALGGGFEAQGWLWFIQMTAVPLMSCLGIAGYYNGFERYSRLKFWLICACMGFLSVLYMGTIGVIVASGLQSGLQTVNVIGYLQWGPIYALILLPISTLIIAAFQRYFQNEPQSKE